MRSPQRDDISIIQEGISEAQPGSHALLAPDGIDGAATCHRCSRVPPKNPTKNRHLAVLSPDVSRSMRTENRRRPPAQAPSGTWNATGQQPDEPSPYEMATDHLLLRLHHPHTTIATEETGVAPVLDFTHRQDTIATPTGAKGPLINLASTCIKRSCEP